MIDTRFEGGSIDVLDARDPRRVKLALRPDAAAEFSQWFAFRARGEPGQRWRFEIVNAGDASYPDAFEDYAAWACVNGRTWEQVPTRFDGRVLRIDVRAQGATVVVANHVPYAPSRVRTLLRLVKGPAHAEAHVVATTERGREVWSFRFSDPTSDEPRRGVAWIIARQHPGEPMGSHCADAIVRRLCHAEDPVVGALLAMFDVFVVPVVNVDGAAMGHTRTNAGACDLNRAWSARSDGEGESAGDEREDDDADGSDGERDRDGDRDGDRDRDGDLERDDDRESAEGGVGEGDEAADDEVGTARAPEVEGLRRAIESTGCDVFLDLHGDERATWSFAAGCEGVRGYDAATADLERAFIDALAARNDDFAPESRYDADEPGEADLSIAQNWVSSRFGCLALTIEMPFHDVNVGDARPRRFTPARAAELGRAIVDTLAEIGPLLLDARDA